MNVFVVEEIRDHEAGAIMGVFSTREKAVAWIKENHPDCDEYRDWSWISRDRSGAQFDIHKLILDANEVEVS